MSGSSRCYFKLTYSISSEHRALLNLHACAVKPTFLILHPVMSRAVTCMQSITVASGQKPERSGNELRDWQKWKWRQKKQEKDVSAPAASGLYFPHHSDFILATNEERALCVSMVTPHSSNDGENKGAGKGMHCGLRRNIFLFFFKFFRVWSISFLVFDIVLQKSCVAGRWSTNEDFFFFKYGKLEIDWVDRAMRFHVLQLYQ